MAFLHCHNCDWAQDDFWHQRGYTPLRDDYIAWLRLKLFDEEVKNDSGSIPGKEFVANQLEALARLIRHMHVTTEEEFNRIKPTWKCPNCGSKDWDID